MNTFQEETDTIIKQLRRAKIKYIAININKEYNKCVIIILLPTESK